MIPLTLSFPLCSHELAEAGFSWCVATAEKLCLTSKTENKCVSIIIVRCFSCYIYNPLYIVGINIKHNPPYTFHSIAILRYASIAKLFHAQFGW